MRLLSLDHLTLFELTPPQLVEVAAQAGFDHVGLRLHPAAPPGERQHPMLGDVAMRRETLARLRDGGVSVFDFGVFRLRRETDVRAFEPVLETAAVLGAQYALVNGDERDPDVLAERLAALCEVARPYGVVMQLEFTPWTGVPDLATAVDVVHRCGHASARVMIDTLHVDRSGTRVDELAAVPAALVEGVQVCDAPGPRPADVETMIFQARNERAFPFEGTLDLVSVLAALPEGLPWSLEAPVASLAARLAPVERAKRGRAAVLHLRDRVAERRARAAT